MKYIQKNQINFSQTSINHYNMLSYENNQDNRQANKILSNIENKISFVSKQKTNDHQKMSQDTLQEKENNKILSNPKQQFNLILKRHWKKTFCKITNILALNKDQKQEQQQNKTIKSNLDLNQLCNQEVQIGNFRLEQILGQGSYATVRLCVEKISKIKYAIKIYDKNNINYNQKMSIITILSTQFMLQRIENQYELIYHSLSIITYLKEGLYIFQQLFNAIKYLHNKNIAHRDIKMENILLLTDNYVKLIDFWFFYVHYMSPELVAKVPRNPQCTIFGHQEYCYIEFFLENNPLKDKMKKNCIEQFNKIKSQKI